MDKIDAILGRLPQHPYDIGNNTKPLYKLINSIVTEFNATVNNINKINNMMSIDTTPDDDMYVRWGALLNIKKNSGETAEQYKNRLKTSVTSLSGGTAYALKYAIACVMGINNDESEMNNIEVYDAWNYPGGETVERGNGYVVCRIDLNNGSYSQDITNKISQTVSNIKAAGVIVQFLYHNFRIEYYSGLDVITYISLDAIEYNKVGE